MTLGMWRFRQDLPAALAVTIYPLLAILMSGLIVVAARIGFPMVMLFAVWTVLVSLMRSRTPA